MQDRMQEPSPRQAWLSAAVLFGKVMAVMLVTHVIVETAVETLSMASLRHGTVLEHAAVAILGGSLMLVVAILPLRKLFDAERHATSARELQMRHDGRRQDFESRLHRAFAMSETEDAANDVVRRAVAVAVPDARSELLLADSSDAHLKRAVEVGPDNVGPRCDVPSPHTCPAIRRGQTRSA